MNVENRNMHRSCILRDLSFIYYERVTRNAFQQFHLRRENCTSSILVTSESDHAVRILTIERLLSSFSSARNERIQRRSSPSYQVLNNLYMIGKAVSKNKLTVWKFFPNIKYDQKNVARGGIHLVRWSILSWYRFHLLLKPLLCVVLKKKDLRCKLYRHG